MLSSLISKVFLLFFDTRTLPSQRCTQYTKFNREANWNSITFVVAVVQYWSLISTQYTRTSQRIKKEMVPNWFGILNSSIKVSVFRVLFLCREFIWNWECCVTKSVLCIAYCTCIHKYLLGCFHVESGINHHFLFPCITLLFRKKEEETQRLEVHRRKELYHSIWIKW